MKILLSHIYDFIIPGVLCKYMNVGAIYRPPNRDMNTFNDKLGRIMHQIKSENKLCYLVGDYNINLLNCEKHDPTVQFLM